MILPAGCLAQGADISLLRQVQVFRIQHMQYQNAMADVTNSAYPLSVLVPACQLGYGAITADTLQLIDGIKTVAALGINTVVAFGLKYAVDRSRPYITYTDIHPYQKDNDPSFPSGHTSYAFALATITTLEYPRWYVAVPAYAWAVTVGYSRLYLGEHYPSDVLAGAIVGAGSAYLSHKGSEWLLHHRKTKKHSS